MKVFLPELKTMINKRFRVTLNGNRTIIGVLRGFDAFMNIVLDECIDESPLRIQRKDIQGLMIIRGNSIISMEPLDKI